MKKITIIAILILLNTSVIAEQQKTIKEIINEVKAEKETTERIKKTGELTQKVPETEEDINVIVEELEGPLAPAAQKVIYNTKNKKFVPVLIKACEKKAEGIKNLKEDDYRKMNVEERKKEIDKRIGLEVLIETLGKMKDKQAIPVLKKLLDNEELTYKASAALSMMGDDEVFKDLMKRMETQRNINLAGIKGKHLKSIVDEIDDPKISQKKKGKLIGQIKGSKDPEVNRMLKSLALYHKDADVKGQAGLALVNSIIHDKSVGDVEFIVQWASMEGKNIEEDWAKGWVVDAMNQTWDERYIPALINMLRKNRASSSRSSAARLLGEHKVQEAVPYLEEAMRSDRDRAVRGSARAALKKITGKEYQHVHPDSIKTMKELDEYEKRQQEEKNNEKNK